MDENNTRSNDNLDLGAEQQSFENTIEGKEAGQDSNLDFKSRIDLSELQEGIALIKMK
ncbi:hypothetical protein JCM19300_1017 [Algibacter lectus]|uniref:Uncharacterized protein n=1 Tax=Algibacter lectus TaxID=221126 RepID=A0A090VI58_9FLAO|nr:hypothetical protein JCM19300_1017 [Algibacter lectus]